MDEIREETREEIKNFNKIMDGIRERIKFKNISNDTQINLDNLPGFIQIKKYYILVDLIKREAIINRIYLRKKDGSHFKLIYKLSYNTDVGFYTNLHLSYLEEIFPVELKEITYI